MRRGDVKQFQVVFNPEYAQNKNVTWKSSDPAVALVDDSGKVTAIGNGKVIMAAGGGVGTLVNNS